MSTMVLDVAHVKAEEDAHVIDFYAATFSKKPDKVGDIIAPGAFDEWLKTFYDDGRPLPVSFAHDTVLANGQTQAMKEMIGYAPATPEYVFVDSVGLRVKAILFDEETSHMVYRRAKAGVVKGASFAYRVAPGGQRRLDNGTNLITRFAGVDEAGPCLVGINDEAGVVGVKAAIGVHHTATYDGSWDGPAVEASIPEDATGEQLARVFAWRDGEADPTAKASYSFLHHTWEDGPGGANVRACIATVAILNGGRGVDVAATRWGADRQGIYNHVAAHLRDADQEVPELKAEPDPVEAQVDADEVTVDEGESNAVVSVNVKHVQAPTHLQAAHDALVRAGAKCAKSETPPEEKATAEVQQEPRAQETRLPEFTHRLRLVKADAGIESEA